MRLPTNFSPLKPAPLFDGLSVHPLARGVMDKGYGTAHMDAIELRGYSKIEGSLKSWVIFHAFILNSKRTAEQYEWTYGGGREFSLTNDKLVDQVDYDHILPWVYRQDDRASIGDKDASYNELYQKYKALSSEGIAIIRNYLNDFSRATGARSVDRTISDASYWQMMVYFSVIEKILGSQPFCSGHVDCAKCGKTNINHNATPQFEWTKTRLIEIVKSEKVAESYRAVIWAVRQKIRHDTVHNSLTPTAQKALPQDEDRVLFDLARSIGNYQKDHLAVQSLIQMIADVARYLLLDDIYKLKIFPEPRPLGVITLRQPGVPVRGI